MEFPKFTVMRSWVNENEVNIMFHDIEDDIADTVENTIKRTADTIKNKEDFINEYQITSTIGKIFNHMIGNNLIRKSPITKRWSRIV